jgi:hypothetical protein
LFSTSVWSQVSNYSFAQSTGTYTSISPGTSAHPVGWDDNQTTAITLPFTFVYNGLNQTQVRIASNGFLSFGSTAPGTGNYAPISATTGYAGAVSAYGRDLIANGGIVEYTTIGLSPNRTFVVQWNNAQRYSGGAVAGDVWNFQIRLNETTNTIQIIYGTCTATSALALTGLTGQVETNAAKEYTFHLSLEKDQTLRVAERTYWSLSTVDYFTGESIEYKGGKFFIARRSTVVI